MANYAFLNENNIVTSVIVGHEEEPSYDWEAHYSQMYGETCKRTSYNTIGGVNARTGEPYRKNYAGIGFTYDAARDAFIPPAPYPSWVLVEESCLWEPPVPMPTDGGQYKWNEDEQAWEVVE